MIHPSTELRFVGPEIGYGVFATADIPKGTLVYVKDRLEIEVTPRQFDRFDAAHRAVVEKYSYMDERGVRILSWDHAKYVNHRCDCNTMSAAYGFEIAIRDIAAGEEITDEYGLFNIGIEVPIACGCRKCRRVLRPDDVQRLHPHWDRKVRSALGRVRAVPQPLWGFLTPKVGRELDDYLDGRMPYRSVRELTFDPSPAPQPRPRPAGRRAGPASPRAA
jgi:hypothetical protein